MSRRQRQDLISQCHKMINVSPASFVFDYARRGMRCGSAVAIAGSVNPVLYQQCIWTSYRFFLELFRCSIGDPDITSARVDDLPTVIRITVSDGE